jgi:hypothetical protein
MTLVPFIDMINHSPEENVSIGRGEEGSLEIKAKRALQVEEIYFSYHSESSRFWLCEYGFWIDGNVFDDLDLTGEISALACDMQKWLENEGYWGYFLKRLLMKGSILSLLMEKYRFELKLHCGHRCLRKTRFVNLWKEGQMEVLNKLILIIF